jgi:hypothetical protein
MFQTAEDQRQNRPIKVAFFMQNVGTFEKRSNHRLISHSHGSLAIECFVDMACVLAFGNYPRPELLSANSMYFSSLQDKTNSCRSECSCCHLHSLPFTCVRFSTVCHMALLPRTPKELDVRDTSVHTPKNERYLDAVQLPLV